MLPVLIMIYVMVGIIALMPVVFGFIVLNDYLEDKKANAMTFSKVYDRIQYDHKFNQAVKAANLAAKDEKDPYYYKKTWDQSFDLAMNN